MQSVQVKLQGTEQDREGWWVPLERPEEDIQYLCSEGSMSK